MKRYHAIIAITLILSGCYSYGDYYQLPKTKTSEVCESELGYGMFWGGEYLKGSKLTHFGDPLYGYGCRQLVADNAISEFSGKSQKLTVFLDKDKKSGNIFNNIFNKWNNPDTSILDYAQCLANRAKEYNQCIFGEDRFPDDIMFSFLKYADNLEEQFKNEVKVASLPAEAYWSGQLPAAGLEKVGELDLKNMLLSVYIEKLESRWVVIYKIFFDQIRNEIDQNIRYLRGEMFKLKNEQQIQSVVPANKKKSVTCMRFGNMIKCDEN